MRRKRYAAAMRSSPAVLAALSAALMVSPRWADATDIRWTNGAGGTFNVAGNWASGAGPVPGTGDVADFGVATSGSGPAYAVGFTNSPTVQGLVVHRDQVTFNLSAQTLTVAGSGLAADSLIVGQFSGETASLTVSAGTLVTTSAANFFTAIGGAQGASGTLTMTNGAIWTDTTEEHIGESSTGVLNMTQAGLTHTVGGSISLGVNIGSSGTLNVGGSGTQLNVSGGVIVGGKSVAAGATGVVNISGGAAAVGSTLKIWDTPGTAVNLSGGSLTVGGLDTSGNPSRFNWTGGTLTINHFLDFSNAADPTFNGLSFGNSLALGAGQSLVANPWEFLYGAGSTITQTGGVNTTVTLYMGNITGAGTPATYNLSGGTLTATDTETLGHMSAYTGPSSTAAFNQTGGINTMVHLSVGTSNVANASYTLNGVNAQVNVTAEANIGSGNTGILNIQSGTMTVGTFLKVWNTGSTAVNLSGGKLTVGTLDTGGNPARFLGNLTSTGWTGGTLGITGSGLTFDTSGVLGASLTFTGSQSLTVTGGDLVIGSTGIGLLASTGPGTFTVGTPAQLRNLILAYVVGASGTLTLGNPALQMTVNGFGYVGGSSGSAGGFGTLNISAGTVSFSNGLKVWNTPGTVVNLSGGYLATAGLDTSGLPARFNWTGGTLSIGNVVIEPAGPLGETVNITAGKNLIGPNGETLGGVAQANTSGTINQSGGSNTVTGGITIGVSGSGSSTYNLSGGTLSVSNFTTIGDSGNGTFNQTGGTASLGECWLGASGGSGTLTINDPVGAATLSASDLFVGGHFNGSGGPGTVTVTKGTLSVANFFMIWPGGIVHLNGGTIDAQVIDTRGIPSHFDWTSGTLNIHSLVIDESGPLGDAVELGSLKNLLTTGEIDNLGAIEVTGAVLGGSGYLVNDNAIQGYGTLSGTGFFYNNGQVLLNVGNFTMGTTGGNFNAGTISLGLGLQLRLTGAGLSNSGVINLNGGIVSGTATLTNTGVVAGNGTIVAPLANITGTLIVPAGATSIVNAFTNGGMITLSDAGAVLSGADITNNGTLQGHGNVSSNVLNNGTVEANGGGVLSLTGGVANNAGGTLSVLTGNKMLVTGAIEAFGTISLAGGTFDTNSQPLDNNGQISGYGLLRTGGLTNHGSITLTGSGGPGTTTVNGPVENTLLHAINIKFDPAIFTGAVTNDAGGTIKTTSTTVTFAGAFTNSGSFLSDPASNVFQGDVTIGTSGSMSGSAGDEFHFSGGTLTNAGMFTNGGLLQSSANITNTGSFVQMGPQAWASGSRFTNNGGSATFGSDAGSSSSAALAIVVHGGSVLLTAAQHLASLTVTGGTVTLDAGTTKTGALNFGGSTDDWSGNVDLTTRELIVQAGGGTKAWWLLDLQNQALYGKTHTGGLTSSTMLANMAVAVIDNGGLAVPFASFGGESVDANSILVAPELLGDANADGTVNFADFVVLSNHFGARGPGWVGADFNADGITNFADFVALSNNFGSTLAASFTAASAAAEPVGSQAGGATLGAPEPSSAMFLGLAAAGMLVRKRRGTRNARVARS